MRRHLLLKRGSRTDSGVLSESAYICSTGGVADGYQRQFDRETAGAPLKAG